MTEDDQLFKSFSKGKKKIRFENDDRVIHTGVSGTKQMDGLCLEIQLKSNEEYTKTHNLFVRERFGGTYECAATDERKEFQRMIKYIKTSRYKISKILVYSLERFSRSENSIWLNGSIKKTGNRDCFSNTTIDTTNPAGITYIRKKDECRSIKTNEFPEEVPDLSGTFATFNPTQKF
jgi:site-specific DNA recombinase